MECLEPGEFSHASDAWMAGCALWEIATFCKQTQYSNVLVAIEETPKALHDKLKAGVRLPRPDTIPQKMFDGIFMELWKEDTTKRMTCEQLKRIVEN